MAIGAGSGARGTAPWYLRLFGGFLVIFNGIGAFDSVMTSRYDARYFEQLGYGAAHLAYFEHYPPLPAFGFVDRRSVFGLGRSVFDLVVPLGLIAVLFVYARAMSHRGVLR